VAQEGGKEWDDGTQRYVGLGKREKEEKCEETRLIILNFCPTEAAGFERKEVGVLGPT